MNCISQLDCRVSNGNLLIRRPEATFHHTSSLSNIVELRFFEKCFSFDPFHQFMHTFCNDDNWNCLIKLQDAFNQIISFNRANEMLSLDVIALGGCFQQIILDWMANFHCKKRCKRQNETISDTLRTMSFEVEFNLVETVCITSQTKRKVQTVGRGTTFIYHRIIICESQIETQIFWLKAGVFLMNFSKSHVKYFSICSY